MPEILFRFEGFEKERDLIGQMLIAYGEIEFGLLQCLSAAIDWQTSTSIRILFRVRGEAARIDVADAIIRPVLRQTGLEGKWGNAIGAARVCKNIRNQYAHCHWDNGHNGLRFVNLDADAQAVGDPATISLMPVDLELLTKQFDYFEYSADLLYFLAEEHRVRAKKSPNHDFAEPKSIPAPPLHIAKG